MKDLKDHLESLKHKYFIIDADEETVQGYLKHIKHREEDIYLVILGCYDADTGGQFNVGVNVYLDELQPVTLH